MFSTIAIVIAVLIILFLGYVARKPGFHQVTRKISIAATPEKVFPHINDLRAWEPWSPFEKKDPAIKRTYSGATAGKGSIYDFEGNNQVGSGRIEIQDTTAPSKLVITLDMIKPLAGHNVITFTLDAHGNNTTVTWDMQGKTPFVGKIFHTLFNFDKMLGGEFEKGLADLKSLAEK